MDEARFSINLKFNQAGFDAQLTLRDDESLLGLLLLYEEAIKTLTSKGAVPARRWENNKNHTPEAEPAVPVCKHCGKSDMMELIDLGEKRQHRKAWKCQGCNKWHYEK